VKTSSGYFESLVESALAAGLPQEVSVHQIEAPQGLAPNSIAFAADIVAGTGHLDRGTGRLIFLDDPDEPVAWGGRSRAIIFAQSPLEVDLGSDEMYSTATWATLLDELAESGAQYDHAAGTVTRVISTGFGDLTPQGRGTQVEVRASWSPKSYEIGQHIEAWQDLVCIMSGFAHLPQGVSSIAPRNNR
jgi:hypothetical protein